MKNVVLIPARGGSKRLPGKNIKELNGKPLIAYTIEVCLRTIDLDRIIVSTDDDEIAAIAKGYGVEVPFIRPDYLSVDNIGDRDVMLHLIDWLKNNENYEFDNLIYLRPTTPFKTPEMICEGLAMLKDSKYSAIRSVTESKGVFHPYWMFKNENDTLKPFVEGISLEDYYQSQLLPECLRLNGVVDITRVETIINNKNLYGDAIGFMKIEEERAIDIDTDFEFQMCDFFIKKGIL